MQRRVDYLIVCHLIDSVDVIFVSAVDESSSTTVACRPVSFKCSQQQQLATSIYYVCSANRQLT